MKQSPLFLDCLSKDARRLRAMARDLRHVFGARRDALQGEFDQLFSQSREKYALRAAHLPSPSFSSELPVNARRDEIAALIEKHPVVIVCGETGSGKTTQLPKICLELKRGVRGLIGHTQPRRIAARSTAARIAEELESEIGQWVGYKVRFTDRMSDEAYIKLMTDGILLAETQHDPMLLEYDTIIIDEAHERSLNIDFLLGYLHRLLPKRPDLKLIITSATIDAERFSRHFSNAPIIEVSGRLYPVEVRYRPIQNDEKGDEEDRDLYEAIIDACDELQREGPGDILVFLPGEREIREAAHALRQHVFGLSRMHPEVLPLFARLSAEEQSRIFRPHQGIRIILATNVAETSLTVPGIRYVVDTGLARVKRYSYRNKVEQLLVENIAQSSANQRSGRCGRVASGVCIRLYDEPDFLSRPLFADPEIFRASLAGVILRMKALRLGEIDDFPFLEKPLTKAISDGYQLLHELGAVTDARQLTSVGEALSRLPIDPKLGRMIIAARDLGCLKEVLVIVAALSVRDPRERPEERQGSADMAHKEFSDEKSEFVSWLKLWAWYEEAAAHKKSRKKLAEACQARYLSPIRMREWHDTYVQLHAWVAEAGWRENTEPASYALLHSALLSGLLGNVGCKSEDSGHYLGARGIKFLIHPASPLAKKAGKWIMAAEITETSRLFARGVAKIESEWLETVGAHLLKKSVYDPHWEKKAMQAIVFERATLYGLLVYPKKRVSYEPINPTESRALLIRQGLVGGEVSEEYVKRWGFYTQNHQLVLDIEALEHKSRRPDVLVDDELIVAFYDKILPAEATSAAAFERWRREAEREHPRLLYLTREDLMRHQAAGVTTEAFPHELHFGGLQVHLAYHFEPGSPRDGVTMTVALAQLNQIPVFRTEWLVPGLLKEKVIQLAKTLPQKIRSKLVPIPEFAADFVSAVEPKNQPLIEALIAYIQSEKGLNARGWEITADAFRPDMLPPHLFFNFQVLDETGRMLGMGRQLLALRAQWGETARQEFSELHAPPAAYTGMKDWSFGSLPELMEIEVKGQRLVGYPALVDEKDSVSLKVFDTEEEARGIHHRGLLRLFKLRFAEQIRYFEKNIPNMTSLAMQFMRLGTQEELCSDLIEVTIERACMQEPWPQDEERFKSRIDEARPRLGLLLQEVSKLIGVILQEWQQLEKKRATFKQENAAFMDIEKQLERLMGKRFVRETPFVRLQHYPRYLKAIALRLDKLRVDPARDQRLMAEYAPLWANYERRAILFAKEKRDMSALEQFRWLLEELRVQLYAQELRTPTPISVKRLQKMWESL